MEEGSRLVKEPPGLEGCINLERGPRLGLGHNLGRENRPASEGRRGSRGGPPGNLGLNREGGLGK